MEMYRMSAHREQFSNSDDMLSALIANIVI